MAVFVSAALGVLAYGAIAYVLGLLRQDIVTYRELRGGLILAEMIALAIVLFVVVINSPTVPVVVSAVVATVYFPGRLLYLFRTLRRESQSEKRIREFEAARAKSEQEHLDALGVLIGLAEDRFVGLAEYEVARRDRSVLAQLYRLSASAVSTSNRRGRARTGDEMQFPKLPEAVPLRAIADHLMLPPGDVWVAVRRLDKDGHAKFVHAQVDDRVPSWGGALITPEGANEVLYGKPSQNEVVMGDKITAGAGAMIINRSTVKNSMNTIESAYGGDVASAWEAIVDEVERSGDESSRELVNAVGEELQQSSPKRSVLKSLFQGILAGAPAVNSLADAVLTFSKALGISSPG